MKKLSSKDRKQGFTIIELIVVIVVIGILATLTTIGISQYANRGEDAQRTSGAIAITESLEKYYDENGEYPSCNDLTGDPSSIVGANGLLPGLQSSALRAPNAPESETNSIRCSDLSYGSNEDYYAYVPVGSCEDNPCLEFVFKYIESSTSEVKSIYSRHKTNAADVGAPSLTYVNKSFTRLSVSWNNLSASSYRLQIDRVGSFDSVNLQSFDVSTTSHQFTGLTPGQVYYVRVAPILYGGSIGYWSNSLSQTTWSYTVSGVAATTNSSSQITVSWNSITVPSTPQSYSVRYSTSSTMSGAETVNGFTSNSGAITGLDVGTTYYFQVRATTGTPESYTSSWYPTSNPPSAITTPPAPATCSVTKTNNSRVTANWSAASGASSYEIQGATNSAFTGAYTWTGVTGTSQFANVNNATTYYMQVRSVASGAYSAWRNCGSATTGIDGPSGYGWVERGYGVRHSSSVAWMPGNGPPYAGNWWSNGTYIYGSCGPGAGIVTRLYQFYAYSNGSSPNTATLMDWTWGNQDRYVVGGSGSWYVWWQGWVACQVGSTRVGDTYLGQYRES